MLQPSNIIQSSVNPVVMHQPKQITSYPVQPIFASVPGKYFTHISKIMLGNAVTKTPVHFYNTLPVTRTPKGFKSSSNKIELARLQSLPLPNSLSLVAVKDPKKLSSACSSLQCTDIQKDFNSCTETASLATKTVMYSTYHTLPSTEMTTTAVKGGSSSNSSSVVMEITGNICSSVLSNSDLGTNPSGLLQSNASLANVCVGVKLSNDPESCTTSDGSAWVKAPVTTNNALNSTASSSGKALNAVRINISGNAIRETQKYGEMSPSKRPVFLNLCSGGGNTKYNKSWSKPPVTNQSLPESPVCEDLNSPTGLFQNLTDTEANIKSRFVQQRRSCSFFIDLNTLADNEQEFQIKSTKNIVKSSESLPATLGQTQVVASSEENLLDSCDEEDGNGDFSSDSLEEPSEFSNRTPRRCISDYQIFTRAPELVGYEFEQRSASAAGRQCKRSREAFHSQESVLTNTSGQLSSCTNSGDILEMCSNYEQDRHSSASFFLSLRRHKSNAYRSQESILTDESEYQTFSHPDVPTKYDYNHYRDSCQSTESILEGDYQFSSLQRGNLTEDGHTQHRDSCQSTESILTDDSDCQLFAYSNQELELRNKLFCSVENSDSTGFQSKSGQQNSECKKSLSGNAKQAQGDSGTSQVVCDNHRPIFRTQSLQDTRLALSMSEPSAGASSSKFQTPSNILLADDNQLQQDSVGSTAGLLVRKNSYPRSRPQTPTSLLIHSQLSVLNKSYTTVFEGSAQPHSLSCEQSAGNSQKMDQSLQHKGVSSDQYRPCSDRPPTAPKPTEKVTHKPPLKPRQKLSQQQTRQQGLRNSQGLKASGPHAERPLKANHAVGISSVPDVRKAASGIGSRSLAFPEQANNDALLHGAKTQDVKGESSEEPKCAVHTQLKSKGELQANFTMCSQFQGSVGPHDMPQKSETFTTVMGKPGGVKLLCRSFENAVEDCDISDDCAEEDSFPVMEGSGSSTPATSSSAANSPKRLWPPASRAPNQRQLGRRLGTRHQILPSKCSGPGNMRPQTLCALFFVAYLFA